MKRKDTSFATTRALTCRREREKTMVHDPAGLSRRALLGVTLATPALAQRRWPDRPVRLVVPFAQGGPIDAVARLLGDQLQRSLGQPFVPEFRSGAGGNIGAQYVAQATPDGSTLMVTIDTVLTVNAAL